MPAARLDVLDSKALRAVIVSLSGAERTIQSQFRKAARQSIQPEWQHAVAEQLTTRLEARVLGKTARAKVSNQNIRLSAASVGRPLAGGLNPKTEWAGVEFGAVRGKRTTYSATSSKGRHYQVTKRATTAQLRPRSRRGYVVHPALTLELPHIAALFVSTCVRTFRDAFEGKGDHG